MATWAKIKFFWDSMLGSPGSTLTMTAGSTETDGDYSLDYLSNGLETNFWKQSNNNNSNIDYDAGHGLFTNGDLETGDTAGWTFDLSGGASATFTASSSSPHEGSYKGLVTITAAGSSTSDIQLKQVNLSVVEGQEYRLIIAAKAAATRVMTAELKNYRGSAAISDEGEQSLNLTTSWQIFKLTMTANVTVESAMVTFKMGNDTDDVEIDLAGFYRASAVDADFFAISGHNLLPLVMTIRVYYSDDNSAWTQAGALNPYTSKTQFIGFSSNGSYRYWRINMINMSAAPSIAIAMLGLKTEIDYASASFDPYSESVSSKVNISHGGFVTGIHTKYSEREMTLKFDAADSDLYNKIKDWWDGSGLKNFFIAWETANNPTDVWLMRPSEKFTNPLTNGGATRDITVNLRGRKE